MATTRIHPILGWLTALLFLSAASSARAQQWLYPVYGPGGVYYVPYYPTYPSPLYPPVVSAARGQSPSKARTTAASASAYGAAAEERPSYYSEDYAGPKGPTKEPSKVAYIRVRVPTNAQLWINDEKRSQSGTIREFVTPALDPDAIYVYHVKARWTEEGGINVEKTLRVRTISGTRVTVNFVRPPEAQPRPSAAPVAAATPSRPRARSQIISTPVDFISNAAPRSLRGPSP